MLKLTYLIAPLLCVSCASTVIKPAGKSPPNYQPPYPFTAMELWSKFLKLTANSDGYITKKQVEDAFGVVLIHEKSESSSEILSVQAGRDWYLDLVFYSSIKAPGLYFDWSIKEPYFNELSPVPENMCINVDEIKPMLIQQGWKYLGRHTLLPIDARNEEQYTKGRYGDIGITSRPSNNCLESFQLTHLVL